MEKIIEMMIEKNRMDLDYIECLDWFLTMLKIDNSVSNFVYRINDVRAIRPICHCLKDVQDEIIKYFVSNNCVKVIYLSGEQATRKNRYATYQLTDIHIGYFGKDDKLHMLVLEGVLGAHYSKTSSKLGEFLWSKMYEDRVKFLNNIGMEYSSEKMYGIFRREVIKSYEGYSMKEFINESPIHNYDNSSFDSLIASIENPILSKYTDSIKKETFDLIKVNINLISRDRKKEELIKLIKENKKEIDKKVIEKIKSSKDFQKFNVPINVLKCTNIVLRTDLVLEYTFEFKNIEPME